MASSSRPPTSKPRLNRVPSPPRTRPTEPVDMDPFNEEDSFEDALEEPIDPVVDRETQLVLSGGVVVKSYDGTSQYTQSGVSACGLASFNAVKEVLDVESGGTKGSDLVRRMLSKELVEQITSLCSEWSSPTHLEVDDIYQMSLFSRALELTSLDYFQSSRGSFVSLLNSLQSRVRQTNRSIASILTKPPEIVAVFAIVTHQGPPKPPVTFVIFDSHSRPQRHPNGTAFNFFGRAEVAAEYLSELFAVDKGLLDDSRLQWQAQLLTQFSSHTFTLRKGSEAKATKQELELDLFRSNVSALETKIALGELTRQVADLSSANERLKHDNDSWRKENQKLKKQLQGTRNSLWNRPVDVKGKQKSNDSPDVTIHVSPRDDHPSSRPRGSVVSSTSTFAPPPLFSESSGSSYPPPSQLEDDHLLAARLFLEEQGEFGGDPNVLPDAELALQMQRDMEREFAAIKRQHEQLSSSAQKTFECRICFETHPEDTLAKLEGCDHEFCRECLRAAITAAVNAKKFPVECPVCLIGKKAEGEAMGVVTQDAIEILGVPEDTYNKWIQLELSRISIALQCPKCHQTSLVDKDDHNDMKIIRCPVPRCGHSWCKQCYQPVDRKDEKSHSCDGTKELDKLMKTNGWMRCPGCQTPTERTQGCDHMTCGAPGCNMHWSYASGRPMAGFG